MGTRPVYTFAEVEKFGWPSALGMVYNPKEIEVRAEVNRLLAALGSFHRLTEYLDFHRNLSILGQIGLKDEVEITRIMKSQPGTVQLGQRLAELYAEDTIFFKKKKWIDSRIK